MNLKVVINDETYVEFDIGGDIDFIDMIHPRYEAYAKTKEDVAHGKPYNGEVE